MVIADFPQLEALKVDVPVLVDVCEVLNASFLRTSDNNLPVYTLGQEIPLPIVYNYKLALGPTALSLPKIVQVPDCEYSKFISLAKVFVNNERVTNMDDIEIQLD